MKVLVTGASGFVGHAVHRKFSSLPGVTSRASNRTESASGVELPDTVLTGGITGNTNWQAALRGVNVVVHTAARVHVLNEHSADPLSEFRTVNVAGTLNLARQAAESGVVRFIFLSSIKVNGETTEAGRAFTPLDEPDPRDPYAVSKREAEDGLRTVARTTGMEVVVIRPVLVYGPGVKANFRTLLRLVSRGIPLPFEQIQNSRSLVALDNLVDLIVRCLTHPRAANETFLVSDGDDLSTPELIRRAAEALGVQPVLFSVPPSFLKAAARLVGKGETMKRLTESLRVNIDGTRDLLDWAPPISVSEGLRAAALDF